MDNLSSTIIDWVPRNQALIYLGIRDTQYRADISLLRELSIIQHHPKAKGISAENLQTLAIFRQLVKERGRLEAAKALLNRQAQKG